MNRQRKLLVARSGVKSWERAFYAVNIHLIGVKAIV